MICRRTKEDGRKEVLLKCDKCGCDDKKAKIYNASGVQYNYIDLCDSCVLQAKELELVETSKGYYEINIKKRK